ncbi:hypothetical protein [Streptomyces sp. NPDC127066]|uniref:hypothetical protein n=1 Tax=Streptomyces sp. NPDC127066 TaxID=3347125 RepID=UPI00365F350F
MRVRTAIAAAALSAAALTMAAPTVAFASSPTAAPVSQTKAADDDPDESFPELDTGDNWFYFEDPSN